MESLLDLAAEYGVAVVNRPLPEGVLGCYIPQRRRILLDTKLTPSEQRSVLAHELGHVYYGHAGDAAATVAETEAGERQADAYAAKLLIDHAEYASLERMNSDPEFLADELGVTVDLIQVYRAQCLWRVSSATYAVPRMGAGQWEYRELSEPR